MSLQIKTIKSKSAVSGMVGYVLLIGIVMAIGTFMYVFLQSYVPADELICPDGSDISIVSYTYTENSPGSEDYDLTINLKNTGRFDLSGYTIYATTKADQKIATSDLSEYLVVPSSNPKFGNTENGVYFTYLDFSPQSLTSQTFKDIPDEIFSIDITPEMTIETDDNRIKRVVCGNSGVSQVVEHI